MKITSILSHFIKNLCMEILDFSCPNCCPYCNKPIKSKEMLCSVCFKKLNFIQGQKCYRCGVPLSYYDYDEEKVLCPSCLKKRPVYDIARSVLVYDAFSRSAILRLKYKDHIEFSRIFVSWMEKAGEKLFSKTDIITPVPLHWRRRIKRFYNQSDLIASQLAENLNIKYDAQLLYKKNYTSAQERKTKKDRIQNVKNSFGVRNTSNVEGKSVLLIDDVLTTGATAENCAKALKKAGARAVYVLTVARSIQND